MAEEKTEDPVESPNQKSYKEWWEATQAGRHTNWNVNVSFESSKDTKEAPKFDHNSLFHNKVEEYALAHTTLSSSNSQLAAKITMEKKLFAPCMVGTLVSQFLKMYTKTVRAERILDIGTFTGFSAVALAEGALASFPSTAHVDTLEFDETHAKTAQTVFDNCEPAVTNAITLHQGNAVAWMQSLADQVDGPTYDIIFIDADKHNYIPYYELAMGGDGRRPLLSENGIILVDNSLSALVFEANDSSRNALHQFNQHVKNDDRVEQVVLTLREGITMICRK